MSAGPWWWVGACPAWPSRGTAQHKLAISSLGTGDMCTSACTYVGDTLVSNPSPPRPQLPTRSLVCVVAVQESANVGLALPGETRSRVSVNNPAASIVGWRHYDSGGPQVILRSSFSAFVPNGVRDAGCIRNHDGGPSVANPFNLFIASVCDAGSRCVEVLRPSRGAASGLCSPPFWFVSVFQHRMGGLSSAAVVMLGSPPPRHLLLLAPPPRTCVQHCRLVAWQRQRHRPSSEHVPVLGNVRRGREPVLKTRG